MSCAWRGANFAADSEATWGDGASDICFIQQLSTVLALHEIRDREWSILPCSAKTGDGLQEGMEWVIDHVDEHAEEKRGARTEESS